MSSDNLQPVRVGDQEDRTPRFELERVGWAAALVAVLVASPISVNVAFAFPQTTITVSAPDAGNAPAPLFENSAVVDTGTAVDGASSETATAVAESAEEEFAEVESFDELNKSGELETASALDPAPTESVRTLSVEPGTTPLIPADSPAWISLDPNFESPTHQFTVSSLPSVNRADVDESLEEPLLAAMNVYLSEIYGEQAVDRLQSHISVDYIRKNLIENPDGYVAELATSNGPMYQKWVQLTVTPEQRQQLDRWHREAIQRDRLSPLALGLVGVLGLIGVSHLVLRNSKTTKKSLSSVERFVSSNEVDALETRTTKSCARRRIAFPLLLGACVIAAAMIVVAAKRNSEAQAVRATHSELAPVPVPPQPPLLQRLPTEVKLDTGKQVIIIRERN